MPYMQYLHHGSILWFFPFSVCYIIPSTFRNVAKVGCCGGGVFFQESVPKKSLVFFPQCGHNYELEPIEKEGVLVAGNKNVQRKMNETFLDPVKPV